MYINLLLILSLCVISTYLYFDFTQEKIYMPSVVPPPPFAPQTDKLSPIDIFTNDDSTEVFEKYSKNKVGWLEIEGLKIREPVMQTTDNSYYLTHNAFDRYSVYGACFALNTNNLSSVQELSRVTVLFGHNAGYSEAFGFSRLKKLQDSVVAAEHRIIYLQLTDEQSSKWEIFAAGEYPIKNDYLIAEPSDDYFLWETAEMQEYSYNSYTGVEIGLNDKILVLSTCTDEDDKRFIVCARLCA